MKTPGQILQEGIDRFSPVKILLLFSGGHDSLVSTHLSAMWLMRKGLDFTVYHGDTTIGIPQTQEFVISICQKYGWDLTIQQPPAGDQYIDIVKQYGFPGPTKTSHMFMYRRLKERALRSYVTSCKSSKFARQNVLLVSGVRRDESTIRMGYVDEVKKEERSSRVWASPIFWWTEEQCKEYIDKHSLPRNPVKDKLCISGECLCGCYAKPEERSEINAAYPDVGQHLDQLEAIAKQNGHNWNWGQGPSKWKKKSNSEHPMFMCVGCESKSNQS